MFVLTKYEAQGIESIVEVGDLEGFDDDSA